MKSAYKIFLGLTLGIFVLIILSNHASAGCQIDTFWRWTDGKDYQIPPSDLPAIADGQMTVQAFAKFLNCSVSGNSELTWGEKPVLTLTKPDGSQSFILRPIDSENMDQQVSVTFNRVGEYYYKVKLANFERESTHISAQSQSECTMSITADASPKQVQSLDEIITLKATANEPQNCSGYRYQVEFNFYHGDPNNPSAQKLITTLRSNYYTTPTKIQQSTTTTARALGYKTGDNIYFIVKAGGFFYSTIQGSSTNFQKHYISSPVSVGVEVPPIASEKYSCIDNACIKDPNGNSLEICMQDPKCSGQGATHKACVNNACVSVSGAGTDACTSNANCIAGGDGGTATQSFEIPNPIGAENLQDLVNIIGQWIFNLAIPIAVIIIIYAGVLMLTAGGNVTRFKKGYMALWYAVIGLAVVLIGKGFVTLIQSILSLRNR